MASLSSLTGLTFSADDYADQGTFGVDLSNFATTGGTTINGQAPIFSNADYAVAADQPAFSATVVSVDTAAATPYGLGTVTIDTSSGDPNGNYTADVIGINAGQVLLGIAPTGDPLAPFGAYSLLSDSSLSLSQDPTSTAPVTFNVSNTDPNAYNPPPCFVAGTRIATPDGEVAVEALRVGDLVVTISGEARRVIWTGSRGVDITRHPRPETVRPVRIEAGAFADNVPSRDLLLSPDHSVHVDNVLIPAKCLVNGSTVAVLEPATVAYHHIELERHDVVLANGLPAETYLDTGNRMNFAGPADTVFMPHPDFSTILDIGFFTWESSGYAPLVLVGPELDAVRARLARRADQRPNRRHAA